LTEFTQPFKTLFQEPQIRKRGRRKRKNRNTWNLSSLSPEDKIINPGH